MTRESYQPGPANIAHVDKEGENWTLVLVRELRHSPEKVWQALTDPAELREWAPFDPDRNMGSLGPVTLATVGAPKEHSFTTAVTRAEPPNFLEFKWGENDTRWQLEASGPGTRLTLWINIPKAYIAMGAAGWQVCFDVLEKYLEGDPIGRIVGMDAFQFDGWQRLNGEYSQQFGIEKPKW